MYASLRQFRLHANQPLSMLTLMPHQLRHDIEPVNVDTNMEVFVKRAGHMRLHALAHKCDSELCPARAALYDLFTNCVLPSAGTERLCAKDITCIPSDSVQAAFIDAEISGIVSGLARWIPGFPGGCEQPHTSITLCGSYSCQLNSLEA
jgi:hypothetical protein